MSTVATPLITVDEFEQMTFERPTELVRGEIVEQAMPTSQHGSVCAAIVIALGSWARHGRHGAVFSNDSYVLTEQDPDTVRGPDCAFVRSERLVNGKLPAGTLRFPVDLAVEVLSPSDRWPDVMGKILEYLRNGTGEVWVIDADEHTVNVYRSDLQRSIRFKKDAVLTRPDLLPGFSCPVAEFFADL
jgi:Uma2 family endonuclease